MQKYKSNITTTSGAAVRGVPVLVIDEDGNNAALFLDRAGTVPAPNPLTTGPDGVFYFYAVNGRYSIRTTVEGVTITDDDVVLMMDPEEITVAGPIAEAVAAAQAAAIAAEFAVEASGIPDLVAAAQNAVVDSNNAVTQANSAANNAAISKTGADSARDAAVIAKNAAEAALDSFDDRYLGQKPANPANDNDGVALLVGALYFRTTAPIGMKVWTGATWDDAYANLSSKFDKTGGAVDGNINFTGAGRRITGDFSNATVASRTAFQTSTANGNTFVHAHPNGTAVASGVVATTNSDATNYSSTEVVATPAASILRSGHSGTGVTVPLELNISTIKCMRLDPTNFAFTSVNGLIGYGGGAGGTVVQATSKSTSVTLNKPSGAIVMHNASLAAGASVEFSLNNTMLSTVDGLIVNPDGFIGYAVEVAHFNSTTEVVLRVTNKGTTRSDAVTIRFRIFKGALS